MINDIVSMGTIIYWLSSIHDCTAFDMRPIARARDVDQPLNKLLRPAATIPGVISGDLADVCVSEPHQCISNSAPDCEIKDSCDWVLETLLIEAASKEMSEAASAPEKVPEMEEPVATGAADLPEVPAEAVEEKGASSRYLRPFLVGSKPSKKRHVSEQTNIH